jgi:phospholipid/cholesterol/gamma-HCH transport system substrate-binding protein
VKRLLAIVALLAATGAGAVALMGAGGSGGTYKVRAIFDNAGFVIPGEDVKVSGVKVGNIDSLAVTPDHKAAVVLKITEPGYQDFRQDAGCIVRPQGLIGERFVECNLTQQRSPGESPPPPLKQIRSGPGKGQYLLSVEHNSKTVDLDLIGDIMREPERQRLSLILNELGTGVAGRGGDLNDVIRRADPALKAVDNLLKVIGTQNRQLAALARNSDTVLAPLARDRVKVGDAIANSSAVAGATAERSAALEASIAKFPRFLTELRPTLTRLGGLSDEMTPVLTDLGAEAPAINRLILQLGPFSQAALPAFQTLGEAAQVGIPAVKAARPVVSDLGDAAAQLNPVAKTAASLLTSFKNQDGIRQAMAYILFQVTAINGMDGVGHYLRAGLLVNQCATYAVRPAGGCSANFQKASATSAAASTAGVDPTLLRTAAALRRSLHNEMTRAKRHPAKATTPAPAATPTPAPSASPAPAATTSPALTPTTAPSGAAGQQDTLLNYLFGKDD